jgi:hypothetical protein
VSAMSRHTGINNHLTHDRPVSTQLRHLIHVIPTPDELDEHGPGGGPYRSAAPSSIVSAPSIDHQKKDPAHEGPGELCLHLSGRPAAVATLAQNHQPEGFVYPPAGFGS